MTPWFHRWQYTFDCANSSAIAVTKKLVDQQFVIGLIVSLWWLDCTNARSFDEFRLNLGPVRRSEGPRQEARWYNALHQRKSIVAVKFSQSVARCHAQQTAPERARTSAAPALSNNFSNSRSRAKTQPSRKRSCAPSLRTFAQESSSVT